VKSLHRRFNRSSDVLLNRSLSWLIITHWSLILVIIVIGVMVWRTYHGDRVIVVSIPLERFFDQLFIGLEFFVEVHYWIFEFKWILSIEVIVREIKGLAF
jgi:hypothetical protein